VEDELCALQQANTCVRKAPPASRKVRVTDQRDQRNSGRKAPSR
jgi:hypothetical protein